LKNSKALKRFLFIFSIALLLFLSCAKRGTITGGMKDTLAPVLKASYPKNFSTNFKGNTIKISFNEYIKLKDVNKQLIVSPPMNTAPVVEPTTASKYINITIKDTLKPNTTYSFNFGQSIQDNNEENPFSQFKYVFSTGNAIDSLKLSGTIEDALEKKVDNFVSVVLYEINEKYSDSAIYNQKPQYVTNTLDSLKTFEIQNIKEGKYKLVAIKDKNNNFKLNPKSEKVGFYSEIITIPTKENYPIKLYKEKLPFKALKPSQVTGNKAYMGIEGNPRDVKISLKNGNEIVPSVVTNIEKGDSIQIWFKKLKVDSLKVEVEKENFKKEFSLKIKDKKGDTLSIKPSKEGTLNLREVFALKSETPLVKFEKSKIALLNKDSIAVAFTTKYDEFKRELQFDFKREPEQKYMLRIEPGGLTDFLDNSNKKLLVYKCSTSQLSDYGNLKIKLENVTKFPVIVELTTDSGEILETEYADKNPEVNFDLLEPKKYSVRIIYDTNANKIWDTGNYLNKIQPEIVVHFPKEIEVRANWDVEQPIDCTIKN
jgi:uncharacterized protein (DUF2141 family)